MKHFVKIDKALNKYNEVVLFPDKVAKANEMLKTIGLPKLEIENSNQKGE